MNNKAADFFMLLLNFYFMGRICYRRGLSGGKPDLLQAYLKKVR